VLLPKAVVDKIVMKVLRMGLIKLSVFGIYNMAARVESRATYMVVLKPRAPSDYAPFNMVNSFCNDHVRLKFAPVDPNNIGIHLIGVVLGSAFDK
jgi:hypothetical protein